MQKSVKPLPHKAGKFRIDQKPVTSPKKFQKNFSGPCSRIRDLIPSLAREEHYKKLLFIRDIDII